MKTRGNVYDNTNQGTGNNKKPQGLFRTPSGGSSDCQKNNRDQPNKQYKLEKIPQPRDGRGLPK
jgi:hypothetical protein